MFKSIILTVVLLMTTPLSADDLSLEALKRMIDSTAHLSEEVSKQPSKEIESLSAVYSKMLPAYISVKELGNIPLSRRVLLDVRSNHSDGAHDMDMLAELAKKRAIDTLVFGEHDRLTIKFGLDPLPQTIAVFQEHPSLYETGLEEFFDGLERVRKRHPDLHFMAATESTPGYHWSGIPFVDLTLHGAERHIIAMGVEHQGQIEALPSYDLRNIQGNTSLSLGIWFALIFAMLIIFLRQRKRGVALLLFASFIAFLSTWLLEKKVDADVDFINTAREQGLFTIWTHPGTLSGVRDGPMGVKFDTPPYSRRVFEEPTADAFAAVYGDSDNNTTPGGMWDRFMMDYMSGYRPYPLWAVAAGDYHAEGQSGEYLGNFPMDVWAEEGSSPAIMTALRRGRNSSWFMKKDYNLNLSALFLEDESGTRLLPGDEGQVTGRVKLYAGIANRSVDSLSDAASKALSDFSLTGEWIVNGRVVASSILSLDDMVSITPLELEAGAHVIRFRIPAQKGVRMESNPFLVRVGGS